MAVYLNRNGRMEIEIRGIKIMYLEWKNGNSGTQLKNQKMKLED